MIAPAIAANFMPRCNLCGELIFGLGCPCIGTISAADKLPAPKAGPDAPAPIKPERVSAFFFAGRAIFTVRSKKTGARFTFKVTEKIVSENGVDKTLHFVAVLTGQDNQADYTFLGTIFEEKKFVHSKKSPIAQTAPSAKAFEIFFRNLAAGALPDWVEVWHEGRCGRCGRPLTVPESVETGLGPVCAEKE